jgi:hypothetical protein
MAGKRKIGTIAIGVAAALAALLLTGATSAASSHPSPQLRGLRAATDKFHSIATVELKSYNLLTDTQGIACIDMPDMPGMPGLGGMGVHWANSSLVGDPAIVPDRPEAMVYAPGRDGTLKLAAVEYVVVKAAWDATHKHPPKLFGHVFDFTNAPNRFGLPPFYSLHVWAWKHNSAGTFAMWNPAVTCPTG